MPSTEQCEIRAMWQGGPFRRWSPSKTTQTTIGYARGGFVGSYVCSGCWKPSDGVYHAKEDQKWLCGPCRKRVRTRSRAEGGSL